jgi:hypothetical protein
MTSKRWSDDPAFREVATPYAVLEMMRDRLGPKFECTFFKGPFDDGSGTIDCFHEENRESTTFRFHCPENYERLKRLARNIATTTGRHGECAQEA